MSVGNGGQGAVTPLDFRTWYRYSKLRLNSAIFRSVFCIFALLPPPPERGCQVQRVNSAIFGLFSVTLHPGNFSADVIDTRNVFDL